MDWLLYHRDSVMKVLTLTLVCICKHYFESMELNCAFKHLIILQLFVNTIDKLFLNAAHIIFDFRQQKEIREIHAEFLKSKFRKGVKDFKKVIKIGFLRTK